MSCLNVMGCVVIILGMIERADQAKIIGALCQLRKVFTESQLGIGSCRGLERSDDMAGCIWLAVEGFQLAGTTKEVDEDD